MVRGWASILVNHLAEQDRSSGGGSLCVAVDEVAMVDEARITVDVIHAVDKSEHTGHKQHYCQPNHHRVAAHLGRQNDACSAAFEEWGCIVYFGQALQTVLCFQCGTSLGK